MTKTAPNRADHDVNFMINAKGSGGSSGCGRARSCRRRRRSPASRTPPGPRRSRAPSRPPGVPRSAQQVEQRGQLVRRAHGRAEDLQLQGEDPAQVHCGQMAGGGAGDDDPGARRGALQRVVEGGRADRLDDDVDPLGQPGAGLQRGRAERGDPLALGRRRGWWRRPACPARRASTTAAVATPPPAPWTSTASASATRPRVVSIRYAVSQAVGRQAASAKDSSAGFGTRLTRGTATRSASVPGYALGERSRSRAGRPGRRSPGRRRPRCRRVVDAGRVAAEDHRQPVGRQADAAQRPQVVVVERAGPYLARSPSRRRAVGLGRVADGERRRAGRRR